MGSLGGASGRVNGGSVIARSWLWRGAIHPTPSRASLARFVVALVLHKSEEGCFGGDIGGGMGVSSWAGAMTEAGNMPFGADAHVRAIEFGRFGWDLSLGKKICKLLMIFESYPVDGIVILNGGTTSVVIFRVLGVILVVAFAAFLVVRLITFALSVGLILLGSGILCEGGWDEDLERTVLNLAPGKVELDGSKVDFVDRVG